MKMLRANLVTLVLKVTKVSPVNLVQWVCPVNKVALVRRELVDQKVSKVNVVLWATLVFLVCGVFLARWVHRAIKATRAIKVL